MTHNNTEAAFDGRPETTNLSEVTVTTGTDRLGRRWTLVATAQGEDLAIAPWGEHVDVGFLSPSTSDEVMAFVTWVMETA
jgi:hypothetical protein